MFRVLGLSRAAIRADASNGARAQNDGPDRQDHRTSFEVNICDFLKVESDSSKQPICT